MRASALWASLSEKLKPLCPITTTVCYGIGNFAAVKRSRYQLALLLLLNEFLQPKIAKLSDPVLDADEISFLTRKGLVIAENDVQTPFYWLYCRALLECLRCAVGSQLCRHFTSALLHAALRSSTLQQPPVCKLGS